MKKRVESPEHLVSLSTISELQSLESVNGQVRIGACVKVTDLTESQEIKQAFTALGVGAQSLGSPLIRNLATIGGNVVTARPAADLPPSLMVYDATFLLRQNSGERFVQANDFFKGPGETVLEPGELLTAIHLDRPSGHAGGAYIKLGVRKALEISLVNVACFLSLADPGSIQTARIVLGAVAPTPVRAPSAENALVGEKPSEKLFERAAGEAVKDCKPITDFRGSAEYRKAMVEVLTKRALKQAFDEALKGKA
jgi:carbon-monoxide dehydrogenase medium subunit